MNTEHMPITSKYLYTDRCGSEGVLSRLEAAFRVVDLIFKSLIPPTNSTMAGLLHHSLKSK